MTTKKPTLAMLALVCGLSLAAGASAARAEETAPAAPAAPVAAAPVADALANSFLAVLTSSLETGKKEAFTALADDEMKKLLKDIDFGALNTTYSPRMKKGYEFMFLGKLRKNASDVNMWKLGFNDNGDDVLVQISIKGGKINGFYMS